MINKKLIPIVLLGAIIFTPAYAQLVAESHGTHTNLLNAIHLTEPQISQIFLETLKIGDRHFYTFDAAQGEGINIELFVPMINGLQEYAPTIAFYKIGEQKEYFRYSPEMFFNEIMATAQTDGNFWVKQAIREVIPETGTYVVEVFDEGDCIVFGIEPATPTEAGRFIEKKCIVPDAFFVFQGKYALQFGTEGRQSTLDNIQGNIGTFIQTQMFFEQPLGDLFTIFSPGGQVETGGSPSDQGLDDLRWLILIALAIVVIVLIAKRKSLTSRI